MTHMYLLIGIEHSLQRPGNSCFRNISVLHSNSIACLSGAFHVQLLVAKNWDANYRLSKVNGLGGAQQASVRDENLFDYDENDIIFRKEVW